jgi:hypothetical protein
LQKINKKTLELLACPLCHGKLEFRRKQNELVCLHDRLAFPIHKGIPLLLEMDARVLDVETAVKPAK